MDPDPARSQTLVARFAAYAAAFEQAFATRDWDELHAFFTEDASYRVSGGPPLGGEWSGRGAVIDALRRSVDGFDRQFDERLLRGLEPPRVDGDVVSVHWGVVYRLEGAPDLRFEGIERARFRDDRIASLEDEIDEESAERIRDYADEFMGGKSR